MKRPIASKPRPALPDRRAMETMMVTLLPKRVRTAAGQRAQDLVYEAFEASGPKRLELALEAIEIDRDCADAYVLLAERGAQTIQEKRDLYAQGLAAGERSLGAKTFQRDAGYFWGVLETRPYMRARLGLAQCLWALGEREAAVEHYREMLRLNPNDNQGVRDLLITGLLKLGRDEDAGRLLERYEDDASATWAYSWALVVFRREGDSGEARRRLRAALECNPHAPAFLLARKRIPKRLPDLVGFGDESEAIVYAAGNVEVWKQTPGALDWLAASAPGTGP